MIISPQEIKAILAFTSSSKKAAEFLQTVYVDRKNSKLIATDSYSLLVIKSKDEEDIKSADQNSLSYYINKGERYGIPVLGVVAVGKEMERTTRYFALATRLLAEQGAHIIKTYYCENFEQITAACPVPIVIAGGKKVPEPEALDMAYRAVNEGAAGVDMGRNVLQAECPSAMLQAIRMVVHENVKPETAYKAYQTLMKDVK